MLKAEWLACSDPAKLLDFILSRSPSERKRRLFACAMAWRAWNAFPVEQVRLAVAAAEKSADRLATATEVAGAREDAAVALAGKEGPVRRAFAWTAHHYADALGRVVYDIDERDRKVCSHLLRCIFGNSFGPVPAPDPAWLAWQQGTVRKLAQMIYDERRFADLPILADALEEAGCDNPDVLAHCRSAADHARGCWPVDWLLGRT